MALILDKYDVLKLQADFKSNGTSLEGLLDFDEATSSQAFLVRRPNKIEPNFEKLSFIKTAEMETFRELMDALESSSQVTETPARWRLDFGDVAIMKPAMFYCFAELPQEFSNWIDFQLSVNSKLASLGPYRLYLIHPPVKNLLGGGSIIPAKFLLTENVSESDFILFADTRTNAPLILQAPEIAIYWLWLKTRHRIEFLGASFNSMFLCVGRNEELDFELFNKDLRYLRQAGPDLPNLKIDIQPLTLRWVH